MFVVRAVFTLSDGTQYLGYLTPPVQGDRSIGTIQPTIVTDEGQVMFWYGIFPPAEEAVREAYDRLKRDAKHEPWLI